jgi:hypothetical protein
MKTLQELRTDFELMAQKNMFGIIRDNQTGEYLGTTFILWAGYWECAVKNNIIQDTDFRNMNKW